MSLIGHIFEQVENNTSVKGDFSQVAETLTQSTENTADQKADKTVKNADSKNGRYGLLVSDLWQHTGFHCGECLEVKVDDKWIQTRMKMDINRQWYLVDTPYSGDLEYVWARI